MKKNYKSIVLFVVMTVFVMSVSACGVKNDSVKYGKQPDFSVEISFFGDETRVKVDGDLDGLVDNLVDGLVDEITDGLKDLLSW